MSTVEKAENAALMEGPYLGLRTFEEADASRYFGREDIVIEVAKMVRRAPLTVLFGVSGTGKSSMIRAGVFPLLRTDGVFPILIRLAFTGGLPDLRVQVRDAITAQIAKFHIDATPPKPDEPLNEYFARTPYWTPTNQLVTPLLVFDQFEEIFTISQDRTKQVEALMDELAGVIERVPRAADPMLDIVAPRPRVMLTLREDFLAHLEDYRNKIPSLAGNRYRLTRMNGAQALRAVMEPAKNLITEPTAIKIVRFVAGGASSTDTAGDDRPLESLEIEPAILSLVCQQLDQARKRIGAPQITEGLIQTQGGRIVENFYDAAFDGFPHAVRELVEDRLVTSDGYRTTMPKAEALQTPGVTPEAIQHLLDDKILREEVRFGSLHIELIHDRLTAIASLGRAKRREEAKEHERERRWWRGAMYAFGGVAFVILVVVIAAALIVRSQRRQAEHAKLEEERKQENAYRIELSTYLARDARDALAHDDAKLANDRIIEARNVRHKVDGADLPEHSLLYKRALVGLLGHVQSVDTTSEIAAVRLWPDQTLVTCTRDGTIRMWSNNAGKDLGSRAQPNVVCHADHHGAWVLQVRGNGSGEVRKRADPDAPLTFDPPVATNAMASQMTIQESLDPARWHACIAPDDSAFAVWADDVPGVRVWAMPDLARLQVKALDTLAVTRVECMAKGRFIAVGRDRLVQLFDEAGNVVQSTTYDERTQITSIATSDDGAVVAVGTAIGTAGFNVRLLRTATPKLRDPGESFATPRPDHLDLSRDGATLLVSSALADGRTFVGLWDTASHAPTLAFDRLDGRARIERSQDVDLLVVAADRQVEAWRLSDLTLVGRAAVDVDLTNAKLSFETVGPAVFAAVAARTTAQVRRLDDPQTVKWADRTLVPAVGNPQSWVVDGNARWSQRSRAGGIDLVVSPMQITARINGAPSAPLAGAFLDARINTARTPRVAVLSADGTVELYSERLDTPVAIATANVRAIRWAADGELITIAADKVMTWTAEGEPADEVPGAADDATLVTAPARVLWTCAVRACTAWDVATKRPRARIAIDSVTSPRLENNDGAVIASVDDWATAFLLPPVSTPRGLGRISSLVAANGDLIGRDPLGSVAITDGGVLALGAGPAIPFGAGQLVSANGRMLAFGSPLELANQQGTLAWAASAAVTQLFVRRGIVGVIEQTLALAAFDLHNPPKAEPSFADWSPGVHATYSPGGDRVAVITPADDVAVRASDNSVAVYKHVAERPWLVRVTNTGARIVAALSPSELLVWGKPDTAPIVKRGAFRDLAVDAMGAHLVVLLGNGQAQIYDVNDTGVPVPAGDPIPAVAIAIDDKGDRIAADEGNGKIRIYTQDDKQWTKLRGHDVDASARPYRLVFSPRGGHYLWIEDANEATDELHSRIVETDTKRIVTVNAPRTCVFGPTGAFAACVYRSNGESSMHVLEMSSGVDKGGYPLPRVPEATFACVGADSRLAVGMSIRHYSQLLIWNPRTNQPPVRMSATEMVGCRYDGQSVPSRDSVTTLSDDGHQQTRAVGSDVVDEESGPAIPLDAMMTDRGELRLAVKVPGEGIAVRDSSGQTRKVPNTRDADFAAFYGDDLVISRAKVWGLETYSPPYTTINRKLAPEAIASREPQVTLLTSPAPDVLVAGYVDGSVQVWHGKDKPDEVFRGFGPAARQVAINRQGWVAVSDAEGFVALWQKEPDKLVMVDPLIRIKARGATPEAAAIAFIEGPDPALVTANADGEVKRWTLGGALPDQKVIDRMLGTAGAEAPFSKN